jgi:hypothetical protein
LSLLLPAAMMCCPNEKMETRLVIWSISIVWGTPQPLSLRKAGWNDWKQTNVKM